MVERWDRFWEATRDGGRTVNAAALILFTTMCVGGIVLGVAAIVAVVLALKYAHERVPAVQGWMVVGSLCAIAIIWALVVAWRVSQPPPEVTG